MEAATVVRHPSGRMLLPTDTGARARGDLLLTGSTGFLGMELLARLLEDTDRRVWAPVRAGDDAEAEARLRATLATLLPDPGTYSERVVAFAADLTRPRLGLGAGRREEIAEHVSEIIHAAASVSFTLPLEEARSINVEGTRRMLELAPAERRRAHSLRSRLDRVRRGRPQRRLRRDTTTTWARASTTPTSSRSGRPSG